jgi:hypothetical protein
MLKVVVEVTPLIECEDEALKSYRAEFNFGPIQPTPLLERIMDFQSFGHANVWVCTLKDRPGVSPGRFFLISFS